MRHEVRIAERPDRDADRLELLVGGLRRGQREAEAQGERDARESDFLLEHFLCLQGGPLVLREQADLHFAVRPSRR